MIYLLSDLHGGANKKGLETYLQTASEEDLLIILGDIGLMFAENEGYEAFTRLFLASSRQIAFLDGNHENFDFLYQFPEEEWNGGKVHRLTEHIVHLKRGNVYTIEGKTFFVFGGCKSSEKWKKMGLWDPREEATPEEYRLAYESLAKHNYQVDYILTHKYEKNEQSTNPNSLYGLTEFIDDTVNFKGWYAGHWHTTETIDKKHFIIYDQLKELV